MSDSPDRIQVDGNKITAIRRVGGTDEAADLDIDVFHVAPIPDGMSRTIVLKSRSIDRREFEKFKDQLAACLGGETGKTVVLLCDPGESLDVYDLEPPQPCLNTQGLVAQGLAAALFESMQWQFVESSTSPYRVPCAIQGDLWLWRTVKDKQEAINTIKKAITSAGCAP